MRLFAAYQRLHWRLFNIGIRLFGIAAGLATAGFVAWGVYFVTNPQGAEGLREGGLAAGSVYLVTAMATAALSYAMLRARPYRPDLGDRTWTVCEAGLRQAIRATWRPDLVDRGSQG
jgi:hypothetical protein